MVFSMKGWCFLRHPPVNGSELRVTNPRLGSNCHHDAGASFGLRDVPQNWLGRSTGDTFRSETKWTQCFLHTPLTILIWILSHQSETWFQLSPWPWGIFWFKRCLPELTWKTYRWYIPVWNYVDSVLSSYTSHYSYLDFKSPIWDLVPTITMTLGHLLV
jgi:hypothetical protein